MKTALVLCLLILGLSPVTARPLTDEVIRQAIIQESIGNYPGPCACPYNTARNGSTCGRRSAYSRPGGYAPICYPSDVTPPMVQHYRATHGP